jgi:dihydroneopterin aldolase
MSHPSGLLEQICVELADHIRKEFPFVKEVLISIKKLNPPIENFVGTVGTTLRKRFD